MQNFRGVKMDENAIIRGATTPEDERREEIREYHLEEDREEQRREYYMQRLSDFEESNKDDLVREFIDLFKDEFNAYVQEQFKDFGDD